MRFVRKYSTRELTFAAILAAAYAALTMVLYAPSYGPVQLRFSEALAVLPFYFPAATPGLFIGCLVANLISPYGPIDVVVGSAATLLAALWTSRLKHRWLAPMPCVVCNGVLVGAAIAFAEVGAGEAFLPAFLFNLVTVGLGELLVGYCAGMVLLMLLPSLPVFRSMIPLDRMHATGFDFRRER